MAINNEIPLNKIKLYLIKANYADFIDVLKEADSASLRQAELPGIGILYFKNSSTRKPDWLNDFFENHEAIDETAFNVSGTCAVLLTKIKFKAKQRIFALPFGTGRFLLKELATEPRFGLVSTLNILQAEGIRSLGKTTISSNPKISQEQISRAAGATDFQINIERDIVESITGASNHPDFGKIISGKDALSITAKVTVNTLSILLGKVMEIYEKKDYEKDFKWIDHIQEVRDEDFIRSLNELLIKNLKEKTIDAWLAVPEILDWSDFNGFKYSTRKRDELHEDLYLEDYFEKKDLSTLTLDDLHDDYITCWRETRENFIKSWSVFQCVNAELDFNDDKYFLDKGKWFRMEKSFVKQVDREIRQIKPYPKKLLDFQHKDEAEYNACLAEEMDALCLDANNLQFGGGASKIEVCDVLTQAKEFFHIKKYGGSANLSHLFAQGYVSGELFITDSSFRELARKKLLKPPYHTLFPKGKPLAGEYSIIYGIISSSKKSLSIPFFSKVTLKSYKRLLEGFGFNLYITKILNIKPPTKPASKKKS